MGQCIEPGMGYTVIYCVAVGKVYMSQILCKTLCICQ